MILMASFLCVYVLLVLLIHSAYPNLFDDEEYL